MLKTLSWLLVVMSVLQMVATRHHHHNDHHHNHHHHINYCKYKCPAFDPPSGAVHLPGPEKNLFYKCNYGIGILLMCPRGTYFNPERQVCDWPSRANAVRCYGSPNYEPEGSGDFQEYY